jgi:predicted metalloprotease with PDZ domain
MPKETSSSLAEPLTSTGSWRGSRELIRRLITTCLATGSFLTATHGMNAQVPNATYSDAFELRRDRHQPVLSYTVRVNPSDLSAFDVRVDIRNASDTLRLAIPVWAPGAYRIANFYRNIRGLSVSSRGHELVVVRDDSSSWHATITGGEATVRYRVAFPSAKAARSPNNRSFLVETGGLIDGPATYVYLRDDKLAPAHVRFELPEGWKIATGLEPTSDSQTFAAASYDVLIDSPVLLGQFHDWGFKVDGIPHRVAFWTKPNAPRFDSTTFVNVLERIVTTSRDIMRTLPYRDYTFIYVDGPDAGLEHLNSTTIGFSASDLAHDAQAHANVSAHEFFHLWNVKRVRPVALGPFDYQHPARTTDLWWSEGVTDYFASEIERRSGLQTEAQARRMLSDNIKEYLSNPAHTRISPERSSWSEWDGAQANGGYYISYYLQGALLGELLELQIRRATGTVRGMDDVERLLFDRFAGARGFTSEDLLNVVNEVCGCDLHDFFSRHVSGAEQIDFDRYFSDAGLRVEVERVAARDSAGHPLPDVHVGAFSQAGYGSRGGVEGDALRLSVADPGGPWGRAGLVTGDELVAINGASMESPEVLRMALSRLTVGATVRVDYRRRGEPMTAFVKLTGYEVRDVRLVDVTGYTERQRALRSAWLATPMAQGQAILRE